MRHVFIINPNAGNNDVGPLIKKQLNSLEEKLDYEIYRTKCKGDANHFVHDYLLTHSPEETYRFYSCGGDGTLYDVVNGAYGFPNAQIACFASGSGNDFVKNFPPVENFQDIMQSIHGKPKRIDLLKIGDRYCVNITNFGFDGEVTLAQLRYKRKKGISGNMAYRKACVHCLFFKMNQPLKLSIDGKVRFDGKGLLVAFANGFCYGGGYHCAPEAKVDDGIMDVCLVKKVSRLRAAGFMKIYRHGEHIHHPKTKQFIHYEKCHIATVESDRPVAYAIDGEVFEASKLTIEVIPFAITFVVPENSAA